MKFSFSTNAYRAYTVEESIQSIASVGYDAVELMCDIPHAYPPLSKDKIQSIKKTLNETDMEISNLNGFMLCAIKDFHHPSWIEGDEIQRKKRIDHTKNCLQLARELNVKSVSTEPGGPPTNALRQKDLNLFIDGLNQVLPLAEKTGVKLLIEPEPELLIENSKQLLDLLSCVKSKFLGLNFDIGHFFCVGEDPSQLIIDLQDYIDHIHLEDIAITRIHKHLIPGHGSINFKKIFNSLEKINYNGFITVELYPYQENPQQTALEAITFLKSCSE